MDPLCPGRIFWAVYPGKRGDGKRRPMIVATCVTDILRTHEVFAVVCSTDFKEPLSQIEIRLPSHAEGKCVTRLRKDTIAVCDWTTKLPTSEITETAGLVPTTLLREICALAGIPLKRER